jgi:N-acetylmuramic acid 6-phosphate etherase
MSRITEQRNPASKELDVKPIEEILETINKEDAKIPVVIQSQLPQIKKAVEKMITTIRAGGSIYLVGAGSSGRMCVLEASEIPPTFGLSPERIKAVIAGGVEAIYSSVEAAEDDQAKGVLEMEKLELKATDLVVGVAASGATPFALGAVEKAREVGAPTVGVSCNNDTPLSKLADVPIEIIVGPEIVAGSTRMRAGTAQKMLLNMMTTTAMMKLGLVYDGYMVGVQATNTKLKERSVRIVSEITGASLEAVEIALEVTRWDVRVASIILLTKLTPDEAEERLKTSTFREILGEDR